MDEPLLDRCPSSSPDETNSSRLPLRASLTVPKSSGSRRRDAVDPVLACFRLEAEDNCLSIRLDFGVDSVDGSRVGLIGIDCMDLAGEDGRRCKLDEETALGNLGCDG